jgi:hypothetical protein
VAKLLAEIESKAEKDTSDGEQPGITLVTQISPSLKCLWLS